MEEMMPAYIFHGSKDGIREIRDNEHSRYTFQKFIFAATDSNEGLQQLTARLREHIEEQHAKRGPFVKVFPTNVYINEISKEKLEPLLPHARSEAEIQKDKKEY